MDHLIDEAELELLQSSISQIPWLGFDHDANNHALVVFAKYPILRGWTFNEIEQFWGGTDPVRDNGTCLAMLQSWLVFGFLEAAFGQRFPSALFVSSGLGGAVIRTTRLRQILDLDATLGQRLGEHQLQHSRFCLNELHSWYWRLREHSRRQNSPGLFHSPEFHMVMRLVVLVAETIHMNNTYYASRWEQWNPGMNWFHTVINQQELSDRLRDRGWCPSLKDLFESYGLAFSEYASFLDPTDRYIERHNACLETGKCRACNVDIVTTQTKHLPRDSEACACDFMQPPLDEVLSVLEAGLIPLIDSTKFLSSSADNSSSIVVAWQPRMTFVAFSHVWMDGLGSDTDHGLPTCRVKALKGYASMVTASPLTWIDALCIPGEGHARKLAIQLMGHVYKQASATIILDAGLQSYDLGLDSSLPELGVRLVTSNWMHRLWTLPECLLSQCPFVAFRNNLCPLGAFFNRLSGQLKYPIEYKVYGTLFKLVGGATRRTPTIGSVQRLLSRRDSSKPRDEALAIAPLLNIEPLNLTDLQDDERMIEFWRLVHRVPGNVIFLNCTRLERLGYTWAPRSLMSIRVGAQMDTATPDAIVTQTGLRATFLVYVFERRETATASPIYISDTAMEQTIAVTVISFTESFSYDAIVALERPRQASARVHAVTLLAAPSDEVGPPQYTYGHPLFLDLIESPVAHVDDEQQRLLCTSRHLEIVIA
ncbi:MAG: hypothetical protein FRX48_03163 [Lasallia pustulata]|uniref:Heterokaryon incompatibility domain-containing protein n=1 Tax=Lasallia pustulata TaxID=136370 RepID=A0A5M8PWS5_9LECA|nr:MAG: hypothetical protein FRX48_03163 [Lasallia pustulata]